ncbi:MAG: sugar phosphate isomerase/epimerase, partial [Bryobacterales bacterium]|nr:sugar phosphate isomerase/epimerase [Bryobacterales bacterium]
MNRRRFVSAAIAATVPTIASAKPGMYLALNSVLVSNRVKWPEFARLAARTGFHGTDVMLSEAMAAGVEPTNKLLNELELKPAALNFPVEFRKDDETFRTSLLQLEDAGRFAAAIGCPRMVTYIGSSSETPKDELRRLYKKRFTESAAILARSQVRLGLEFLGPLHIRTRFPNEFIWRMNEMLQFAKECGPNVGLLLDAWHWHHAGATTADIVAAGKERIVHVHFDDAPDLPPDKIRDNERLLPGEGVIDLTGFLKALQKIGYQDGLSVE